MPQWVKQVTWCGITLRRLPQRKQDSIITSLFWRRDVVLTLLWCYFYVVCPLGLTLWGLGAVSIRKTVLPGMAIPMLKIRRPLGRLIFNMGIAIPGKTVFLIETAPWWCINVSAKRVTSGSLTALSSVGGLSIARTGINYFGLVQTNFIDIWKNIWAFS